MKPVRWIRDNWTSLAAFAVAAGVAAWFYFLGKLTLSQALTAASSMVLAFFTVALWQATAAQSQASRQLEKLESRLALAESTPLLYVSLVELYLQESEPLTVEGEEIYRPERLEFLFHPVVNLGKYGLLVTRVELMEPADNGTAVCVAAEDLSFPLLPGERKRFSLAFEGIRRPADWYQDEMGQPRVPGKFHRFLKYVLAETGGATPSFIRFELVYGGLPQKRSYLCLRFEKARSIELEDELKEKQIAWKGGKVLTLRPFACPSIVVPCKRQE